MLVSFDQSCSGLGEKAGAGSQRSAGRGREGVENGSQYVYHAKTRRDAMYLLNTYIGKQYHNI